MPRLPASLPADDALLSMDEAGALCKVSGNRWPAYAQRFPVLQRARRIVQVNPTGKGVARWLKSAVIEHMHREMARQRPDEAVPVPEAPGRTS